MTDQQTERTTHGKSVEVDGQEFDIERVGRDSTGMWFELNIQVKESRQGTPNHEFTMILEPGGRSALTDQYIESKLQSWSESHPDYTIESFGISEGKIARVARPMDSPEVDNDQ